MEPTRDWQAAVEELQNEIQAQRLEIEHLRAQLGTRDTKRSAQHSRRTEGPRRVNRRGVLRAAAAAAAGVAAASLGTRATPAAATDGQPILLGSAATNDSATGTTLTVSSGTGLTQPLFTVDSTGTTAPSGTYAIYGSAHGAFAGVAGKCTGQYGSGVLGFSDLGDGVVGLSQSGADLRAAGTGVLRLNPQGQTGPPSQAQTGEVVIDGAGQMYVGSMKVVQLETSQSVLMLEHENDVVGTPTTIAMPQAAQYPTDILRVYGPQVFDFSGLTAAIKGYGAQDQVGVIGQAAGVDGVGVYAASDAGRGVWSQVNTGTAIVAESNGVGLCVGGSGRLQQATIQGIPESLTGLHYMGEQMRDNTGNMWICVETGGPGTWKQVATTDQGLHTMPNIRVLNTRPGKQIGPFAGPIANDQLLTLVLAGTNGIPWNASGVVGNLTAADATGGCFLALVPSGANHAGVSSVNFPVQPPGTGIANSFIVGLGAGGAVDIYTGNCSSYTVNIIMDITGYII